MTPRWLDLQKEATEVLRALAARRKDRRVGRDLDDPRLIEKSQNLVGAAIRVDGRSSVWRRPDLPDPL